MRYIFDSGPSIATFRGVLNKDRPGSRRRKSEIAKDARNAKLRE
jgi:hypothetical protein